MEKNKIKFTKAQLERNPILYKNVGRNFEYDGLTVSDMIKTIENLNKITGKQYYLKANKGGVCLEEEK